MPFDVPQMRCCAVVLNCDGCGLLRSCLASLMRQDFSKFNTVVVDNGSSDGSLEMLAREFPQVRLLAMGANRGFSIANNVALRDALARGFDYIMLLNNDTQLDPACLREMHAAIQADERIAAVSPKIYFAAQPDRLWYAGADFSLWTARIVQRGWKKKDRGQFDGCRNMSVVTGCCMLIRASALRDAGLLDEVLWAYLEDVEWSVRFLRCGYVLQFAPKARLWHHDGATWVRQLGGGSQAKRQFFSTRNLILIGWKHARWWQWPGYLAGFFCNHLAFYSALRVWRGDFRALGAIYRGAAAGLACILRNPRGCARPAPAQFCQ